MLNLEQIAKAVGGVLVTAAARKTKKSLNIQHHKTFGVKAPKVTTKTATKKRKRS